MLHSSSSLIPDILDVLRPVKAYVSTTDSANNDNTQADNEALEGHP